MPIGKNVRKYRTLKKWTLRELGKRANLAESTLSDIERDVSMPSIKALTRIADALGVDLDYLLKED
jgi:transcriptional regulator with XRE-family HTH domain